jgi:hypothetical protein
MNTLSDNFIMTQSGMKEQVMLLQFRLRIRENEWNTRETYLVNHIQQLYAEVMRLRQDQIEILSAENQQRSLSGIDDLDIGQMPILPASYPQTEAPLQMSLSKHAAMILMKWFQENSKNPYPTEMEKLALMKATGLNLSQLDLWFVEQRSEAWAQQNKLI